MACSFFFTFVTRAISPSFASCPSCKLVVVQKVSSKIRALFAAHAFSCSCRAFHAGQSLLSHACSTYFLFSFCLVMSMKSRKPALNKEFISTLTAKLAARVIKEAPFHLANDLQRLRNVLLFFAAVRLSFI